ncbi:MAG: hypothetical protein Q4E55_03875 [Bacteroidales bacterium]|nr:hypothetical protein [Bacteroidales bacterium]
MNKTIIVILLLTSFTYVTAQEFDRQAIRQAVQRQMLAYPASTLKDIYKNFFQDAFGPGHILSDSPDAEQLMLRYLESECKEAANDPNPSPDYELTGWHGRFYRVNLSVVVSGKVPLDTFFSAFLTSARQFTLPRVTDWADEWAVIVEETEQLYPTLPDFTAHCQSIDHMLSQGRYASHHSDIYNSTYHPHYRLIERTLFEQQLLPLLR